MSHKIRIATRESTLALWQAHFVRDRLLEADPEIEVEIIGMTTEGDRNKRSPLSQIGGKGVFVKELELALLNGDADIAVHSMKDVPAELPSGLSINAICERADPRDAFVSVNYDRIEDVPAGGRIGSSSLRRRLQIKASYSELEYQELRGNVGTRLAKLDAGDFDGIILAVAGLVRLGYSERISEFIPVELCIPSAGQGAVGIESVSGDSATNELLRTISHPETELCVSCERLITRNLAATCNLPIAAFAEIREGEIYLSSFVSDNDGGRVLKADLSGPLGQGAQLAEQIAVTLLEQGAQELIQGIAPAG
ncbi:MAG: hydroxymethylbilane synthase [Gammaproteobacteria bacterium]|jgi:hydroxymethylbilane synthase|nr:hydroxymethylbilane synthase [Gammaproteobacteria bacterium]|tara:strand:+ start:55816 stop:56745 length:930 start_codon:yes stop_codon:yes gene_type:complete